VSDALERVAALIAEVGECYQRARRYRALAATSEVLILDRALDLGAEIRAAERRGHGEEVARGAAAELSALAAACRAAIAGVHASSDYRRAAAAWAAGQWEVVAATAPALFAAVEAMTSRPVLHYPVAITARHGGEHFITPRACADVIAATIAEGLTPPALPPDLGGDETIRAVMLTDDPSSLESPIGLALDGDAVALPLCRVVPAGDVLVYTERLRVPMRVATAPEVTDEWWTVRPDAYRRYVAELTSELAARGITAAVG
jgi:hypothetical protein